MGHPKPGKKDGSAELGPAAAQTGTGLQACGSHAAMGAEPGPPPEQALSLGSLSPGPGYASAQEGGCQRTPRTLPYVGGRGGDSALWYLAASGP